MFAYVLELPLLTASYTILCTRRLQPPRDDCAVRVQCFPSVYISQSYPHMLRGLFSCFMSQSLRMKN